VFLQWRSGPHRVCIGRGARLSGDVERQRESQGGVTGGSFWSTKERRQRHSSAAPLLIRAKKRDVAVVLSTYLRPDWCAPWQCRE
jgi:hypothetical protein